MGGVGHTGINERSRLHFMCMPLHDWLSDKKLASQILYLRKQCFGHFSPEDNSMLHYSWLNRNPQGCSSIIVVDYAGNLRAHMGFGMVETKIFRNSFKVITIFDSMVQRPLRQKGLYRTMLEHILQSVDLRTPLVHFPSRPVRLNSGVRLSVISHKLRAFLPLCFPHKILAEELSSQDALSDPYGDPRSVEFLQWRYALNTHRTYKFFKVGKELEGASVIVLRRIHYRGVPIWLLIDSIHGGSEILPDFLVGALAMVMRVLRSVILMPLYGSARSPGIFEVPVFLRRSVMVVHAQQKFQDVGRFASYLAGAKLAY